MSGSDGAKKAKKAAYTDKILKMLAEYNKGMIVGCDNIGSHQMQKIRGGLRAKGAVMLCGKNTLIRRAIRMWKEKNPTTKWVALTPYLSANVAIIFSKGDLAEVRNVLELFRVPAGARIGSIAPTVVVIPKGQTSLEPTKTSFLQALNIATKINKNQIEILQDVTLIKAGDKVGNSEATLLQMLKIMPFEYFMKGKFVYDDGSVYPVSVLDITADKVLAQFTNGIKRVASVSLATHQANLASFPHVVSAAWKNVLAVGMATAYTFPAVEKVKSAIAAGPVATAAPAASSAPAAAAPKAVEPKKEEKPESDDMGFDLFG